VRLPPGRRGSKNKPASKKMEGEIMENWKGFFMVAYAIGIGAVSVFTLVAGTGSMQMSWLCGVGAGIPVGMLILRK